MDDKCHSSSDHVLWITTTTSCVGGMWLYKSHMIPKEIESLSPREVWWIEHTTDNLLKSFFAAEQQTTKKNGDVLFS